MEKRSRFLSCMGRGFEILRALGNAVLRQGGDDTNMFRIIREPELAEKIASVLVDQAVIMTLAEDEPVQKPLVQAAPASEQGELFALALTGSIEAVNGLDVAHQAEFLRQFDWMKDPKLFKYVYQMMPEAIQMEPAIWEKWNALGVAETLYLLGT